MEGIEQPNNIESSEEGWKGNWKDGERPEGYRKTTDKYRVLHEIGFSFDEETIKDVKELINRAEENGGLSEKELKEILRLNKKMHEAMDEFTQNADEKYRRGGE